MSRHVRGGMALALWLLLVAPPMAQAAAQVIAVRLVMTDVQGTPVMKKDLQGHILARYDYRPYGAQQSGPVGAGPGYTGHVNDPQTGLVYMQQRYYDADVKRFLSVDPVGVGLGNVFSFNRFAYVNNNPIMHVDPTGMACGGNGEVSAKTQAMRDTSDGCGGSMSEHAKANFSADTAMQQPSSVLQVAAAGDYTTTAPKRILAIVQSPLVQSWEQEVRKSHDFNARPPGERKENGAWVYENDSEEYTLVSMPEARRNPTLGSFSEIAAGDPPGVDGYHPVFSMHSHPFAMVGKLSSSQGFTIMGYPQPSQNDINYSKGHNNLPGMVISHDGDFFYGTGSR